MREHQCGRLFSAVPAGIPSGLDLMQRPVTGYARRGCRAWPGKLCKTKAQEEGNTEGKLGNIMSGSFSLWQVEEGEVKKIICGFKLSRFNALPADSASTPAPANSPVAQ